MHVGRIEIKVHEPAEGVHMHLLISSTVEPLGHEMRAPAFFQQAAFAHLDTRLDRHEVVRILDAAKAGRVAQYAVAAHVEFEKPMLIFSRQVELSGDDLVGLRVPADDGLGASAAGRTTDIQNLLSDLAEI